MKKNIIKIILDVGMAVLLFLMYRSRAISLTFHEAGGLAVCGLFVIHKLLNWKWIAGVTRKLFSKTLPARTRLGYLVDFALLLSVGFIAVSGVMISEALFPQIAAKGMLWKSGHYFASAISLILVGVHIGLHWSFLRGMFAKGIRLPAKIARPIGIVLLAALVLFGCYSLAVSSFAGWFAAPFTASIAHGGFASGDFSGGAAPEGGFRGGNGAPVGGDLRGGKGERDGEMPAQPADGQTEEGQTADEQQSDMQRPFSDDAQGKGFQRDASFSPLRALDTFAKYGSIAALFAVLTCLTDFVQRKLRKPKAKTANQNNSHEQDNDHREDSDYIGNCDAQRNTWK